MTQPIPWNGGRLMEEVRQRCGAQVSACFQCHKCSTGCPIGPEMDFLAEPDHAAGASGRGKGGARLAFDLAVRFVRGVHHALPHGIDIAGVMDALRILAIERRIDLPDARGKQFNRSFLGSVRRHGRVFEMGMMAAYKLRIGDLLSDVDKVPQLLAKGKLSLLPDRSGDIRQVRGIFRRAEEED